MRCGLKKAVGAKGEAVETEPAPRTQTGGAAAAAVEARTHQGARQRRSHQSVPC